MRKFFVGGNWKMNGSVAENEKLLQTLNTMKFNQSSTEVVVAPPSVYLEHVKKGLKQGEVSAQNCYHEKSGAYTGEVSPAMLLDLGIKWVILGHSERRALFHETSEVVGKKTAFALNAGLKVIACIGEKLEEREAGTTSNVVLSQLNAIHAAVPQKEHWANIVIAYEPVWAIGTGKVATPEQAQEVHVTIRSWLNEKLGSDVGNMVRVIYGGSVNGKNCADLAQQSEIDGFLVGGASLKPEFADIVQSGDVKVSAK